VIGRPEKRRSVSQPCRSRGGQGNRGIRAQEGAASLATPPNQPYPRDRREISLRAVFRAIETAFLYGSLREMSSHRLVDAIRSDVARLASDDGIYEAEGRCRGANFEAASTQTLQMAKMIAARGREAASRLA
jgi:hypothetical protein